MALDILNEKFLVWVSKNKSTFLLVVLLLANGYQYVDRKTSQDQYDVDKKALNDKIQQITNEELEYERMRSEKMEFLLNNLPKHQDDGSAKTHSNR